MQDPETMVGLESPRSTDPAGTQKQWLWKERARGPG